jgi:hypothetical protein
MPPEQKLSLDDLQRINETLHLKSPDELRLIHEALLANLPPQVQELFRQNVASAANRPPRPRLTEISAPALRALHGEALDLAIYEYVAERVHGADDPCTALSRLPRGLQVCYLSFVLEVEVMNGGLDQFFDNPSGEFSSLIAPALRELDAIEAAQMFEQVLSIVSKNPAEPDLDKIDHAFARLAEQFPARRAEYVRKHEDQFLTGAH